MHRGCIAELKEGGTARASDRGPAAPWCASWAFANDAQDAARSLTDRCWMRRMKLRFAHDAVLKIDGVADSLPGQRRPVGGRWVGPPGSAADARPPGPGGT